MQNKVEKGCRWLVIGQLQLAVREMAQLIPVGITHTQSYCRFLLGMFLSVSFGRTITSYIDLLELGGVHEETYAVVEIRGDYPQEAAYILEEVECSRALFELYEGGVVCITLSYSQHGSYPEKKFMHQGETFIVSFVGVH